MIHANVFGVLYCTHAALPADERAGLGAHRNRQLRRGPLRPRRLRRLQPDEVRRRRLLRGAAPGSRRSRASASPLIEPGFVATELPEPQPPRDPGGDPQHRQQTTTPLERRGHRRRHPLRDRLAAERRGQRGADSARRAGPLATGGVGDGPAARGPLGRPGRSPAARRRRGRPAGSCGRGRSARAASASISRRARWQSASPATSTCADSAGKPLETSQTCRSWTSTTPGSATSARPTCSGSRSAGAASRKIRAEARTSASPSGSSAPRPPARRSGRRAGSR